MPCRPLVKPLRPRLTLASKRKLHNDVLLRIAYIVGWIFASLFPRPLHLYSYGVPQSAQVDRKRSIINVFLKL